MTLQRLDLVTEPRDLYTGRTVWQEYSIPQLPVKPLTENLKTEVLVVGAGISGAFIAQSLSAARFDVAVVDRRPPLRGSTAASTALLQYEIDTPLTHLSKQIGRVKAIAAWRRSKLAVETLACKIRELNIDCAYERRNTLYLSGNVLNPDALAEESAARNAIGLRGMLLERSDLKERFGVRAERAILSWDNVAVNPVQLAAGLLTDAIRRGATLLSPVAVRELKHGRGQITALTDTDCTIQARYVVFATGYEIPEYIHSKRHKITTTWAIATEPIHAETLRSLPIIWEAADPYLYLRATQDGRLICGGEDEEFSDEETRDALLAQKTATIEQKLRTLLPDLPFTVADRWAGAFGTSTTGLPSIGLLPGFGNLYAALGYGGNGITFSAIAADILTARLQGQRDVDERIFAFPR